MMSKYLQKLFQEYN